MPDATLTTRSLTDIDTSSLDPVQRVLLGFLAKYREPTRSNYYGDLEQYSAWCEQQRITMLGAGPLELQLYIEHLRGRGLAEATVARRYGTVATLLRYAYRLEVIPRNPADFVDRPTVNREMQRTPRLSPLELADVIRHAKRHNRPLCTRDRNLAIVLLMGVMGLRVGEVCGLNIEGLVEAEGQPAIKFVGKRRKVATMVLPWEVLQAIRATVEDRTTGPVFVKLYGTHAGERIDRVDVARVIEALCVRAGIERHITPHSFRRSFAKTAHMQGRGLHEIQEAMRHKDGKMTSHYIGNETTGTVATQAVSAFLASLSK